MNKIRNIKMPLKEYKQEKQILDEIADKEVVQKLNKFYQTHT